MVLVLFSVAASSATFLALVLWIVIAQKLNLSLLMYKGFGFTGLLWSHTVERILSVFWVAVAIYVVGLLFGFGG